MQHGGSVSSEAAEDVLGVLGVLVVCCRLLSFAVVCCQAVAACGNAKVWMQSLQLFTSRTVLP